MRLFHLPDADAVFEQFGYLIFKLRQVGEVFLPDGEDDVGVVVFVGEYLLHCRNETLLLITVTKDEKLLKLVEDQEEKGKVVEIHRPRLFR